MTASAVSLMAGAPAALANGGATSIGGAGGVDSATSSGGNANDSGGVGGGPGGGAGTTGGSGGDGGNIAGGTKGIGGAGAAAAGGNGIDGTDGTGGGGGGGGGGGAHGFLGAILPTVAATGGNGGNAGNGSSNVSVNAVGGGGGAGGFGAVVTGSGNLGSLGVNVSGGLGGNGGTSVSSGGGGGSGGIGLTLTNAAGAAFTVDAAISGGNAGASGASAFPPGPTAGGAGLIGQNLTITMGAGGAISGGLSGNGATRANAITFTGGTNSLSFTNATSGLTGNVGVTGSLTFAQPTDSTLDQIITGTGSVTKTGAGTLTLSGVSTYAGGTTISAGKIAVTNDSNLGNVAGALTFNGGALRVSTGGGPTVALARNITLLAGGGTVEATIDTILSGNIGGAGSLTTTGASIVSLSGTNNYTGATNVMAGQLQSDSVGAFSAASAFTVAAGASIELRGSQQSIGSLAGAGSVTNNNVAAAVLTTGLDNTSTTFSGVISDAGAGLLSLVKAGSGTQTLSGVSTYGGTTTVNAGTLSVNGSIASSSLTTVNAGGTLGGNGTVGNTTINGGTLSPGNSIGLLTVQGNLVFTAASSYMVEISPVNADRTNVTGTATLGGATVNASFAAGSYVEKKYTIINATGGVSGTFSGPVNTNLPGGFHSSLSYDANNAYLDLALNFVPPPGTGLSGNQQNVGNAIVNFFNTNGGIPLVFGGLTQAGLTQVSGEVGTGSQQSTFNAMNQFLGVLTDPFIAGRGDPFSAGGNPNAYADEQAMAYARRNPNDALAAIHTKAPPPVRTFEQRWSVWAAGYGGSQTTSGNAVLGSNDTRSSLYGTAVGADYRLSPNTLAGFALAGGGTSFSVANNLGSGRSDLFQAGAFIRHNVGPAYLSGALAYGWQDITTNRTLTIAGVDQLRAQFNANAWSGRVEGGYRFVSQGFGWTPYAAGQFTTFDLPAYAERAIVGANTFALAYGARSATNTRSELGLRTDKSFAAADGVVTLRGRLAWAHDYNPDRTIGATFQTLPGASFVVNGARQASDSALVTASAEKKWLNGWSAAATFEGEFSNVTTSYAGKGMVRYAW